METQEKNVVVLNDLIEINNDRIVGYQKAIEESKDEDADLKEIFTQMIHESHQYKSELVSEVQNLGGEAETTDTTNSGKIYRAWMDIKATFTGHDRKTVLSNCEFGEDAAQKAYKMALSDEADLPAYVRQTLTAQQQKLKVSHDKIKMLRDSQS